MGETSVTVVQQPTRGGRSEHSIAIVACWPIAAPSLALLANKVVPPTSVVSIHLGTAVVYGLFALALAGSLRLVARRITPLVACIVFILIFAFSAMVIFDQDHGDYYLSIAMTSFVVAVPWLLVANAVHQRTLFLRYLYIAATVILVAGVVRLYFPDPGGLDEATYSQFAGYQMLPAVLIFVDDFLHRRRFRSAILAIVAVVLLVGAGARGPLFALLLYLIARAAVALRRRPFAAVVLSASGVAIAVGLDVVAPRVLGSMRHLFAVQGLSTRAIDRLIAGSFLEDRRRVALVDYSWDLILTHPATGVGLARDRLLLAADMGKHDPDTIHRWYPHNIFLELLVQWGVVIGGLLILLVVALIIRAVLRDSDGPTQRVILIFVGSGFFPLLVSGSYLTSAQFFALAGFCLATRPRALPAERQRPRFVRPAG